VAQSTGLAGAIGADAHALVRRTWWVFLIGGLASILFGILVIARPVAGTLTIVYLIASWAIVIGALKLAFAFRIRKLPAELESRFSLRP
jgi:uncharacterized membrane protein HdeD (DUF308 family)